MPKAVLKLSAAPLKRLNAPQNTSVINRTKIGVKITPKANANLGPYCTCFSRMLSLVLRHLIESRILAHLPLKKTAPIRFLGEQSRDNNAQHAKREQRHHPRGTPRNFPKCARGTNDHAGEATQRAGFRLACGLHFGRS